MKSKFTKKAFIFPLLAIFLISTSVKIVINNWPISLIELRWINYFMAMLVTITIVWLAYFEIYRKMVFIEIEKYHIKRTTILGIKSKYIFNNLKGYKISIYTTRIGNFEELKINLDAKTVYILSELNHINYKEMKNYINKNLDFLGGPTKSS